MVQIASSNNIIKLVSGVLQSSKKYITRLRKEEYILLTECGLFNVNWCYDRIHTIITPKKVVLCEEKKIEQKESLSVPKRMTYFEMVEKFGKEEVKEVA